MKRWLAGLAAFIILFTGMTGIAEKSYGQDDSGTRGSPVSREEAKGSLSDNLLLLGQLIRNEDVQSLFQIQDVKDITKEIALKVLIWMLQNRPVTMKIMAELGVSEHDRVCIEKLWDSADRISDAAAAYRETEDGRMLAQEVETLQNDPDFTESLERFREMITSNDVAALLKEILNTIREGTTLGQQESELTKNAVEESLDRSTFTGVLIVDLIGLIGQSDWAKDSLPQMLENENLWQVLIHLSQPSDLNMAIQEECRRLAEDPEIIEFLQTILKSLTDLQQDQEEKQANPGTESEEDKPASKEDQP